LIVEHPEGGHAAVARGILARIRRAITHGDYDVSAHALGEMAEDKLDLWDLEAAILTGKLRGRQRDDPRGTRYVIHLLIITAYRIAPPEG